MAAESWSLRGVDRRTREAALTAARKEGITVGEWLNRQVLGEDGQPLPENGGGANTARPHYSAGEPDNVSEALERLARRIEAAEHRSTLAITGIDQSVLGLISRLQNAEENQSKLAVAQDGTLTNLRETQDALARRIAKLETDGGAAQLESLKALQSALDKVTEQAEEQERQAKRRIDDVRTNVDEVADRVDRSVKEIYKRVDEAGETNEIQLRKMRDDFERALEEKFGGKSLAGLEEALEKVSGRLGQAEQLTNNAVRALEATFASLDERVREAESAFAKTVTESGADAQRLISEIETRVDGRVDELAARLDERAGGVEGRVEAAEKSAQEAVAKGDETRSKLGAKLESLQETLRSVLGRAEATNERIEEVAEQVGSVDARIADVDGRAAAIEQSFQERFGSLSDQLSAMVAETRTEIARELEQAAEDPRVDRLEQRLAAIHSRVTEAERRHADTLDKVANEVARMAGAVENRLRQTEQRAEALAADNSGLAEIDRVLETRLREIEANSAHAIDRVGDEVGRMADRLSDRISDTERRSFEAIEDMSERMSGLAARIGDEGVGEDIAKLLEASEQRTSRMVEEAMQGVRETTRDEVSPIQGALAKLSERLEALEDGAAPAFSNRPPPPAEFEVEPPPFDDAPDAHAESAEPDEDAPDTRSSNGPFGGPAFSAGADEAAELAEDATSPFSDTEIDPAEVDDAAHALAAVESDLAELLHEDDDADEYAEDAPVEDELDQELEPELEAQDVEADLEKTSDQDEVEDEDAAPPPFDDAAAFARALEREHDQADSEAANGRPRFDALDIFAELDDDDDDDAPAKPRLAIENPFADDDAPGPNDYLAKARRSAIADEMPGFGPAETPQAEPARMRRGRPLMLAASGLAFLAVGAAFYMLVTDGARRRTIEPAGDDARNDVLGGAERNRDRRPPGLSAQPDETPEAEAEAVRTSGAISAPSPDAAAFETPAPNAPIVSNGEIVITSTRPDGASRRYSVGGAAGDADALSDENVSSFADEAAAAAEVSDLEEPSAAEADDAPRGFPPATADSLPDAPEPMTVIDAAAQGDPVAQYQLGMTRLQSGDADSGVELIRQAAENGLAPAQYRLAKLYETGRGLERDIDAARLWTERAANAGHRNAMHNLGIFYAEGRGAEQSFETAANWFERAARLGARDSQYNLGVLHEQGLGVTLDLEEALVWYSVAARSGDADARTRADAVAERLTAEQREAAEQRAVDFRPQRPDDEANGVFGDLPWDRPVLTGAAAVQRTQSLLNELGYDAGPADGQSGERTRAAIASFQRDNGLAQTGEVDAALLERLEAAAVR